jgi:hypothetical protein
MCVLQQSQSYYYISGSMHILSAFQSCVYHGYDAARGRANSSPYLALELYFFVVVHTYVVRPVSFSTFHLAYC